MKTAFVVAAAVSGAAVTGFPMTAHAGSDRGGKLTIYHVAGVVNSGDVGETFGATVIHCTNLSQSRAAMEVSLRDGTGVVKAVVKYSIAKNATMTFSTKFTKAFSDDVTPAQSVDIEQGSATVRSSARKVICSAAQVDAASDAPNGVALHMVRLNPISGTVE